MILISIGFVAGTIRAYDRITAATWAFLALSALLSWRAVAKTTISRLRENGVRQRRVAIAGSTAGAERIIHMLRRTPGLGQRIVGVYDDRGPARRTNISLPVKGSFQDLLREAASGTFDDVYIALPNAASIRVQELVRGLADTTVDVRLLADLVTFGLAHSRWHQLGDLPMIDVFDVPSRGTTGTFKRVMDLSVASIALVLMAPLMILIAIAIKATSRGPVLFRQRHLGLNGREFRLMKFRTMTVCEDGLTIGKAPKVGSRLTTLGRFLRQTSLDELPQFIHVITGEMSLVGPHAQAIVHNEAYRTQIQGYMRRHKVKPGITGWAEINGFRGVTDEADDMRVRTRYDLEYIRNWSVWLDFKIILRSIAALLRLNVGGNTGQLN